MRCGHSSRTDRDGPRPVPQPVGHHVRYVTSSAGYDSSLTAIDIINRPVTATIPVGGDPASVAGDAGTHTAVVAHHGARTVSVIDTGARTVAASAGVKGFPEPVAVDHIAYVTIFGGPVEVIEKT